MKKYSMRNKINDLIGNYYPDKTAETNYSTFNKTGFYTNRQLNNKDLDEFAQTLSMNRSTNYRNNILNSSSGFSSYSRPNSARKIQKSITFFNNQNQNFKKFPIASLHDDQNNKKFNFQKVVLGSTLLENYKKNMKDNLSVFHDYKPMKRYYISDLRNVPSHYQKNKFNERKVLNPLNPNQKIKKNEKEELNNFKSFGTKSETPKRYLTIA